MSSAERFPFPAARERWLDFAALSHETMPLPREISRDGDALVVVRDAAPGRPVRDGRVPRSAAGPLLLQAAGAVAFFEAHGVALDETDLADATWESEADGPRLHLARTPAAVARPARAASAAATLAAFLDRLSRPARRGRHSEAAAAAKRLAAPEAEARRAGYALAAVYRSFPALAGREGALARRRTAGLSGPYLRDLPARARVEAARALLEGARPRVFLPGASALAAGSALPIEPAPRRAAEASRRLRALAEEDAAGGRTVWIAAAADAWDPFSRRAFEAASGSLPPGVEIRELPARAPAPRLPDEWRREVFVPCGHVAASLAFYEWLAREAPPDPEGCRALVAAIVTSDAWAAFAADPTGQRPLPRVARPAAGGASRPAPADGTVSEDVPARRVERLIESGDLERAAIEAERWYRGSPPGPAEAWFALSARLAAAGVAPRPWHQALEAERELAGGRGDEARRLFDGVAGSGAATEDERRAAALRAAETTASLEGASAAGRRAEAWRGEHPGAPAGELARALRLEARGLARDGRREEAAERLDAADRLGEGLPDAERVENALARASLLSLEGRFEEEAAVYERFRGAALASGDDALAARFVAQEALGLSDRRRHADAAARLEEALAVLRDDPAERARLSIDLAATLYHAGRPERCEALLREAEVLAAAAGRRDLLRLAGSNAVELALARFDWETAARTTERLLEAARAEDDALWESVARHHRARAALLRGDLDRAREENARARELAESIGDRLESGELWLEEGDRRLFEEDLAGAREAWERAAADPPDRCETERRARERLAELAWRRDGGPPEESRRALARRLEGGDPGAADAGDTGDAAETAARWRVLFGPEALGPLGREAERVLRARGSGLLADRIFGRAEAGAAADGLPRETLRRLRAALARAFAGEGSAEDLAASGIRALTLYAEDGEKIRRLGALPLEEESRRTLEAGAARYELALPRGAPEPLAAAAAWLAETLLFRAPLAGQAAGDFVAGWRRLGIVTEDATMDEPWRRLVRFAAQPVTVLVRGESGSGKEAVARAVHALSPRAAGPFVPVNVPAIPAALLESELFGHVRGAFTGADRDRTGLLEEAARGTIFLDEIGDLAPALQAKLLRALQDREIRRLGENRARRIDVRIVSATSRDLAREAEAGRFREDLYYRLHVAVIALPPLRDRGRDALRLARHFLRACEREYGRRSLRLAPEAAAALEAHAWPGNVRELQNAIAQAAALAEDDGVVALGHLPEAVRGARPRARATTYRSSVDAHRKGMISDALARAGGNRSLAARELGLSRQALRYLIRELGIPLPAGGARSGAGAE